MSKDLSTELSVIEREDPQTCRTPTKSPEEEAEEEVDEDTVNKDNV